MSARCKDHPEAPQGFDRNGSHNAGRYVCVCDAWEPAGISEIELPEPCNRGQSLIGGISKPWEPLFTDEQVRAAILAERERCARVCEELDSRCPQCAAHNDHEWCDVPTGADYAAAIRRGSV